MKRNIPICLIAIAALSSCVSMRDYETLQAQYSQTNKSLLLAKQEAEELRGENAELVRQHQAMTAQVNDFSAAQQECEKNLSAMNRSYAALQTRYDTTVENYLQQLTGKNRDLSKINRMLDNRTDELNEKERAFQEKELLFQAKEQQLLAEQQQLQQRQRQLEQQLEEVRNTVSNALMGFNGMGLNIESKGGKVYVLMEDKLLFASGSWTVSQKGVEAIQTLARVLEQQPTLTVMVEGHTDNDAYHGSTAVKDNWDLSVMRATAIVKLLLKYGSAIDPARIEAAGHGEFSPRRPNTSAANKAANRRTEIILSPRLDDLIGIINEEH